MGVPLDLEVGVDLAIEGDGPGREIDPSDHVDQYLLPLLHPIFNIINPSPTISALFSDKVLMINLMHIAILLIYLTYTFFIAFSHFSPFF